MSKTLRLMITLLVAVGASLSACHLEDSTCTEMPASWAAPYPEFLRIEVGEPGTQVTFRWFYPGTCLPDRFRIIMNDIPYIGGGILYDEDVPVESGTYFRTVFEDGTTAIGFTFTPEETFIDGWYWWWVIPYSGDYRGETSPASEIILYTAWNNRCPVENWHLHEVTELVYPANGSTIHTLTPTLIWRDRNPQLTRCGNLMEAIRYGILYSQETDDLDLAEIRFSQPPGIDSYFWSGDWILPTGIYLATSRGGGRSVDITLTECRRTYWQVNLSLLGPDLESSVNWPSETHYFDVDPALCEGERPPEFFIPMSEWLTPTAKILEPANCRSGPTTEYPVLDILVEGAKLPIQGQNRAGDSWLVEDVNINHTCWVHGSMVEVIGDTSLVEIINPDPPPTAVPTDTPQYNCAQYNSNLCSSHPQCVWEGGVCKNKP